MTREDYEELKSMSKSGTVWIYNPVMDSRRIHIPTAIADYEREHKEDE